MTFEKMGLSQRIKRCREFSVPYRITDGSKFKLKDIDPADTGNLEAADKPQAKEVLVLGVETLAELQARLYAQDQWAVLALFQASPQFEGRRPVEKSGLCRYAGSVSMPPPSTTSTLRRPRRCARFSRR